MDSLTQLVLGAAVGEIALGRKIGNRALIWGAIGGTIPDLDVLANPVMNDIDALAFHRGITHSIFFSVVAPIVFGGLVFKLYDSKFHKTKFYKGIIAFLNIAVLLAIAYGVNYLLADDGYPRWWFLMLSSLVVLLLLLRLYNYYIKKDLEDISTRFSQWYWLFFLAFATHWLLDCFTAFGTQIFQPFSDYRVAFNNIAVVDPLYTIPFLICVIAVAGMKRNTRKRILTNWIGIGISSLYMIFTLANKVYVDSVFEKALKHRQIEAMRCRATPTILNNFLWNCVAEDSAQYYVGLYSNFDSDPNLHYLNSFPKHDTLHQFYSRYPDYRTLEWFSNGYLAIFPADSVTMLSDLRFGGIRDTIRDHRDLVFSFVVRENKGELTFTEHRQGFEGDFGEMFRDFLKRIAGY